jgi:peptidoglycan hydrolase-like protein with peptidoglycan-binding domain
MSKLKVGAFALMLSMGVTVTAFAETSTTTNSALVTQIQSLLQQIKTLQEQIANVNSQIQSTIKLTRSLAVGMTGEDVSALQEILAADPDIYPEGLVTGRFGPLTEKAVKRFQKKWNIEQAGLVGPKTRGALERFLGGLSTSTRPLPPGLAKKLGNLPAIASSTLVNGHKLNICHKGETLSVDIHAAQAHLGHGDSIGTCGTSVLPATTTPDTTAPVISNLTATSTASTTASITWNTNEGAKGTLWYSTSTPVNVSVATMLESSSLLTSHSRTLTGLSATTTYYYLVNVKDLAGNSATSSQGSITTLGI